MPVHVLGRTPLENAKPNRLRSVVGNVRRIQETQSDNCMGLGGCHLSSLVLSFHHQLLSVREKVKSAEGVFGTREGSAMTTSSLSPFERLASEGAGCGFRTSNAPRQAIKPLATA